MQGSRAKKFFILISGTATILKGTTVLATLKEGATFGEQALFSPELIKNKVSLKALSSCDLLVIRRGDMRSLLDQHPEYCARLEPYLQARPKAYLERHADLLNAIAGAKNGRKRVHGEKRKRFVRLIGRVLRRPFGNSSSEEDGNDGGDDDDWFVRETPTEYGVPVQNIRLTAAGQALPAIPRKVLFFLLSLFSSSSSSSLLPSFLPSPFA